MTPKFFLPWASFLVIASVAAGCGGGTSGTNTAGSGAGSTSSSGGAGGAGGDGGGILPGGCNPACVEPQVCSASGACIDPGTCAADADCAAGTVCDTATGKCIPGGACGSQEAKVDPVPPNMLLVVDRSCSMTGKVGDSTKWNIAVAAINKMTTDFTGQIRFGLTLFPDRVTPNCQQDKIPIPVGPGNEMAVQTLMTNALKAADTNFPDGPCVTNIQTGMQQATTEPAFLDTERDSYAVLITDGKETCGSDATTEQIIKDLHDMAGVPTFVIGFGAGIDPAQMDKFAVAGGVPSSGATKYFDAGDQASLDTALATIAKSTLSCTYSLDSVPPNPNDIYVFFDNVTKVPRDLMDGWEYDIAKNQIVFYGPACDSLKNGIVKDLDIVFGCDTPTPD
ncbi:MAG: VWA domain-containing protein [Polyangiaceae bacterium]|nr:VWA domain-containing protein [Polyangiaceae bacterium]